MAWDENRDISHPTFPASLIGPLTATFVNAIFFQYLTGRLDDVASSPVHKPILRHVCGISDVFLASCDVYIVLGISRGA
ncbi:hypothetical protein BGW80DRAFT_1340044 [Lactifluus volemus]|nr:hypothetical protein BGW80DRAFT_1340044 [Lactifluus volemus]